MCSSTRVARAMRSPRRSAWQASDSRGPRKRSDFSGLLVGGLAVDDSIAGNPAVADDFADDPATVAGNRQRFARPERAAGRVPNDLLLAHLAQVEDVAVAQHRPASFGPDRAASCDSA